MFLSYRSVDAPAVEAFATRLLGAGLDAWFDRWEITAGDDIVAKMDAGVDGCHAALIFLSEAWFDGRWAQDEYTSLALRKVEDGIRLIPIMLGDVGARLPSRLRKLARRGVADFESICDALLGVDRKPGLATALRATTRAVDVVVEAHDDGRMSAALVVDGELRASAQGGRAPSGWDLGEVRSSGLLAEVGRRIGAAVFPPAVGVEIDQLLDGLGATAVVDLRIRADDSVAALPFEAALLPSGRSPVLHPAVRMWRTRHGPDGESAVVVPRPAPGPLKILVAVGVPDEGQTPNVPLDVEAEMGSILDAVAEAVRDERAQVRVLEATDRAAIAKALAADDYHVLHLSGHGNEDCVEMADEDGVAVSVSAADLVESFQASGKVMPLVFVSSCRGGRTATGLAFRLHREGVSRVVAMQAPVSDGYATELATAFYRHLSRAPWPRAGVALAAARRDVEAAGRIDATRAQRPEWATATLLLTGEDVPLLDTDLPQVNLTRPPVHTVNGPVPAVEVRDLIGRRRELRTTLRALLGNPRFTAEHGEVGGVALTGTGGVGKSTVAGRAMARLAEAGWVCVATQGAVSLAAICRALAAELSESRQKWAGGLAEQLGQVPDDDDARLAFLERALRRDPLLLVLDNFEDNLTTGGGGFIDEARSALCEQLLNACAHGKLLFTCRHPLPGMMDAVHEVRVGPLSAAETRRLFLRLDGLKRLGPDDVQLVRSLVGGHPRVLEFLDALMRRGAAVDRVRPKLRALAREEGIDPRADRDVAAAVSDAVRLGARDILLDELLGALDDQERSVLLQVAVSGLPVAPDDLVVADRDGELSLDAVIEAAGRLVDLSLLVAVDGELWVHRWTAEALRGRQAEDEYRGRCRRAGEMRVRRLGSASRDVAEGIEAVENFVAADAFTRRLRSGCVWRTSSPPRRPERLRVSPRGCGPRCRQTIPTTNSSPTTKQQRSWPWVSPAPPSSATSSSSGTTNAWSRPSPTGPTTSATCRSPTTSWAT